MNLNPLMIFFISLTISCSIYAQEKSNVKFGKITPADFNIKNPLIDSSTEAVVIADIGNSEFVGNTKGDFSILFKRYMRIQILDKRGIDAATIEIPLYVDGNKIEVIQNLKGISYNLENGKVIETKLQNESIYNEKLNKNISVTKFTMPAVKPGTIIEINYTINSDFIFNIQSWDFQGIYPRLWSEYQVEIPEYFRYIILSQGSTDYYIKKREIEKRTWKLTFGGNSTEGTQTEIWSGNVIIDKWVMKDITSLKEEPFSSTVENYISKIQFQMANFLLPDQPSVNVMNSWEKTMSQLMESEDFGYTLHQPNNWLDDELKIITKDAHNETEKAKKIYQFVKNNFTATSNSGLFLNSNLKNIFNSKHGNVAEINLLLTTMLLREKIKAYPVILSTKNHGFINELYPMLDKFNYVICYAEVDHAKVFLDAAIQNLGFGQLHWKCYNGRTRIVDPNDPKSIILDADSLTEKKYTVINIINNEKTGWTGTTTIIPGDYESMDVKNFVSSKGLNEFFNQIQTYHSQELKILSNGIDSLKKDGLPVNIHYEYSIPYNKEDDLIYFYPIIGTNYKENPFKSANRKYPVEMPYTNFETIYVNLEAPTGYIVDEIPKSGKAYYNDNEGYFEYIISKPADNAIQIRCQLKMKKANFLPEEYQGLRDFFTYVVKKHTEPVVFKRKT